MSTTASVPASIASQFYILPGTDATRGRAFPIHGFTIKSLYRRRFQDAVSAPYLTISLLLPALEYFNNALGHHVNTQSAEYGEAVTVEEMKQYIREAAWKGACQYMGVTARLALQTLMASYLMLEPTPRGDAVVYSWDSYPRVHNKYVGDVLEAVRLPRFLASLYGPLSPPRDIAVFDTHVPFLNAVDDSIKRHVLITIADIVVTNSYLILEASLGESRFLVPTGQKPRHTATESPEERHKRIAELRKSLTRRIIGGTVARSITLAARCVAEAVGNQIGGGRGEYWMGYVGAVAGTIIGTRINIMLILQQDKPSSGIIPPEQRQGDQRTQPMPLQPEQAPAPVPEGLVGAVMGREGRDI